MFGGRFLLTFSLYISSLLLYIPSRTHGLATHTKHATKREVVSSVVERSLNHVVLVGLREHLSNAIVTSLGGEWTGIGERGHTYVVHCSMYWYYWCYYDIMILCIDIMNLVDVAPEYLVQFLCFLIHTSDVFFIS